MDYSKSIQEIRAVARAGAVILQARINQRVYVTDRPIDSTSCIDSINEMDLGLD